MPKPWKRSKTPNNILQAEECARISWRDGERQTVWSSTFDVLVNVDYHSYANPHNGGLRCEPFK